MDATLYKRHLDHGIGKEKLKPVFYSPDKEQLKAFLLQEIGVPSAENVKFGNSSGRFVLRRYKGLNVVDTIYNDQFVDWVEDIYMCSRGIL